MELETGVHKGTKKDLSLAAALLLGRQMLAIYLAACALCLLAATVERVLARAGVPGENASPSRNRARHRPASLAL